MSAEDSDPGGLASGQAAIWDHFQNEGRDSFEGARARLAHLARLARRRAPGGRVLDVGVGGGLFAEEALARGLALYCVDPNERALAELRERLGLGDTLRTGTASGLPFEDASFDVVCMSEVLEHLEPEELDAALTEAARVLSAGGALIGTVPHAEDLRTNHVVCPRCSEHFHRWGHVQSFTRAELRERLEARFAEVHLSLRAFPNWTTLNWKGRLAGGLKRTLNALGVHGAGESLVFQAARRR